MPPFIHCAQDSPQPPLETPAQFKVAAAASAQVPVAGLPNCWNTGAGPVATDELDDEPPPAEIVTFKDAELVLPQALVDVTERVPLEEP